MIKQELVILNELSKRFNIETMALNRDNGLSIFKNYNGQQHDQSKKGYDWVIWKAYFEFWN